MIVIEFTEDLHEDGRTMYFIGLTDCVGNDKEHEVEIYQQLDAQTVGWA